MKRLSLRMNPIRVSSFELLEIEIESPTGRKVCRKEVRDEKISDRNK